MDCDTFRVSTLYVLTICKCNRSQRAKTSEHLIKHYIQQIHMCDKNLFFLHPLFPNSKVMGKFAMPMQNNKAALGLIFNTKSQPWPWDSWVS